MDETTRESGQIGVFLLDDHEIVRKGVRDLLEAEPDIVVVGEAGAFVPVAPEPIRANKNRATVEGRGF